MPPKRAGRGRKKNKQEPDELHKRLQEVDREYFIITIKDLEERLMRYKNRCHSLEDSNKKYLELYEQVVLEKKETINYLKKTLEQKLEDIEELNAQLEALRKEMREMQERHTKEIIKMEEDYAKMHDYLTTEIIVLNGKLQTLEEFRMQRDEYMKAFEQLEAELTRNEQQHAENLRLVEKQRLLEQERIRREMVEKVTNVAAEYRKHSERTMAETTKRVIRENVLLNNQMVELSKRYNEAVKENEELTALNKQLRQQIALLDHNEKYILKKHHMNLKMVEMLTHKCKDQQQQIDLLCTKTRMLKDTEESKKVPQTSDSKPDLSLVVEQQAIDIEQLTSVLDSMRSDLLYEAQAKHKLESILSKAAYALREYMNSSQKQKDQDTQAESLGKRVAMLESLLNILNTTASLGIGFSPQYFAEKYKDDRENDDERLFPQTKAINDTNARQQPSRVMGSPAHRAHYQPGDLGFIPKKPHHLRDPQNTAQEWSASMSRLPVGWGETKISKHNIGIQKSVGARAILQDNFNPSDFRRSTVTMPAVRSTNQPAELAMVSSKSDETRKGNLINKARVVTDS